MSAYAMCVVCKKVIGPLDSTPVTSDCLGRSVNAHDLGWAQIDGKWHCSDHNDRQKLCTKCLKEFPATFEYFHRHRGMADGLRTWCKLCVLESCRQYRISHRDSIRESHRKRRKLEPEKVRRQQNKYRERNREKINEQLRQYRKNRPDEARRSQHKYYQSHPEVAKQKNRRRRARLAQAEGSHTVADMRRQYDSQKGKCWWCGKPVAWEERHDDHLIPLNRGGTNWPNNMVVSCASCNLQKNDRLPYEWIGRLF